MAIGHEPRVTAPGLAALGPAQDQVSQAPLGIASHRGICRSGSWGPFQTWKRWLLMWTGTDCSAWQSPPCECKTGETGHGVHSAITQGSADVSHDRRLRDVAGAQSIAPLIPSQLGHSQCRWAAGGSWESSQQGGPIRQRASQVESRPGRSDYKGPALQMGHAPTH